MKIPNGIICPLNNRVVWLKAFFIPSASGVQKAKLPEITLSEAVIMNAEIIANKNNTAIKGEGKPPQITLKQMKVNPTTRSGDLSPKLSAKSKKLGLMVLIDSE